MLTVYFVVAVFAVFMSALGYADFMESRHKKS